MELDCRSTYHRGFKALPPQRLADDRCRLRQSRRVVRLRCENRVQHLAQIHRFSGV
jgi:hypothetical protein